eukprot:753572-Hanusia_phi.AAC.14
MLRLMRVRVAGEEVRALCRRAPGEEEERLSDHVAPLRSASEEEEETAETSGREQELDMQEVAADEEAKAAMAGLRCNYDNDLIGLDVWHGATRKLCEYCGRRSDLFKGAAVLELGAGVGILGMVLAKLGARSVYISDYDDVVLEVIRANIKLNGLEGTCLECKLDWSLPENFDGLTESSRIDVIVGSDLLYSSHMAKLLYSAIRRLLDTIPDAVFVMSHKKRYSVTWNEAREPVVETSDSVLESFKSMFVPLLLAELPEGRQEEAKVACMYCIEESKEQEGVDLYAFGRSRDALQRVVNDIR